jgi:hypothetical protein
MVCFRVGCRQFDSFTRQIMRKVGSPIVTRPHSRGDIQQQCYWSASLHLDLSCWERLPPTRRLLAPRRPCQTRLAPLSRPRHQIENWPRLALPAGPSHRLPALIPA